MGDISRRRVMFADHVGPIRLVIWDDAELVARGVTSMVRTSAGRIDVVATATSELRDVEADVALVDGGGPRDVVFDRLRIAVERDRVRRVVLFTWRSAAADIDEVLALGAAGVVSKTNDAPSLIERIERVHAGELVVDPVDRVGRDRPGRGDLTAREVELLTLLAAGLSNAEIGERAFLATSSVKTYLKFLYAKLGISSRTQATLRAVELGLVDVSRR